MLLLEIFEKYEHYKVFPLIYSIKNKLEQYHEYHENLCQLCFSAYVNMNCDNSDNSDDIDDINMSVVNHLAKTKVYTEQLLCLECNSIYSKQDVLNLIQDILNLTYHNEGDERFNEYIKLFSTIGTEYVTNPYEKLLTKYLSYDMFNDVYHKKCSHLIELSNEYDNVDILCQYILDIIYRIDNLYYTDYLRLCPLQYMEILIKKGIDINHVFNMNNQTIFGSLLYDYLTDDKNNIKNRIDKLISLGADVNIGNPIRYITGIQYENKPLRIEKIKYLKKIGMKFNNICISNCLFNEQCKFHKMLYDTRLGKLIQSL